MAFVGRSMFIDSGRITHDGHTMVSVGLAINAQLCDKPGYVAAGLDIGEALAQNARLTLVPLRDVAARLGGSVEAYCGTVSLPFLNNENSLMLLMQGAAELHPTLTARDLGRYLSWLRLACVLVFAYALLRAGTAIPLTVLTLLVTASILLDMREFRFSMYSFFIPLLALMMGAYSVATLRERASTGWLLGSFVVAGFATAFCTNMRTSHLPIYLAMFAVYVAVMRQRRAGWPFVVFLGAALICFALGYSGFTRVFISPLVPDGPAGRQNKVYHVIAHPLVLGLAVPESDFSRRHGIQWLDERGLRLAQRMVPDATYLGPGYEAGLFLYYLKLWLTEPAEMRRVYAAKFAVAGAGVLKTLGVAGFIDDGRVLLLLFGGAAGIAAWVYRRHGHPRLLIVVFVSSTAALMYLESAMIFSTFSLQYYSFLLVASGFVIAAAVQGVVDVAATQLTRKRDWPT